MKINLDLIAEFYNKRFDKVGAKIESVGWKNHEEQNLRFDILFRGIELNNKTILDVGCGLGDLVPYLKNRLNNNFYYVGIDISKKLITHAKKKYSNSNVEFIHGDINTVNFDKLPSIDVSIASGAFSFKAMGIEEYTFNTLNKMFEISKFCCSSNFLTKNVNFELLKNQHYYPDKTLLKAYQISDKINLINDYPLYEFTIQIFK